jgi:hypothetical protein
MSRILWFLSLSLSLAPALLSQQEPPSDIHQHTAPPADARYEIVQSELAAKWTFRLDRFTGHVSQLVQSEDHETSWVQMQVFGLAQPNSIPARDHYQIFTSGLAAKHTFLIDTNSGKTWLLVTGKRTRGDGTEYEVHLWQPFAE